MAAKAAGWRVILVARSGEATAAIRASGIEVIPVDFNRRRANPFPELLFVIKLAGLYRRLKPDLVHHIALKPILAGGLAARIAGVPAILNAPVGLGFVFSSDRVLAKLLKPFVSFLLRFTLSPRRGWVVFRKPGRFERARGTRGWFDRVLQPLSAARGVDLDAFFTRAGTTAAGAHHPDRPHDPRKKGVGDFVEAARILQARKVDAQFCTRGSP